MTPLPEIQLTRRVMELREACPEAEDFATHLHDEIHLTPEEAQAVAMALEDRFLSPAEQGDLLATLELRASLAPGSTTAGFVRLLAGSDGREALRHHARHLVDRLSEDPRRAVGAPLDDAVVRELAELLPHGMGAAGACLPFTPGGVYGIYHYLSPQDPFLCGLAAELRGNWESSSDPILRMRSARVLAELGDRGAAEFLRQSEGGILAGYSGTLSFDERISRACGLAVDGHPLAIRFLQNLAMNPEAATERRARALNYLPPQSLDNGTDAGEVFRSLAEDPDEPVATRYLMLRLLARSPNPPDPAWWQDRLSDTSMTVQDRMIRATSGPGGEPADFSQWNLVLAALSESRAPWSRDLLWDAMGNHSLPASHLREALMAYILHEGRGTLPWDRVRDVLSAQSGWMPLLAGEGREGELRLRFPARIAAAEGSDFDIRSLDCVGKEIVLSVREGVGGWMVDFRPLDPMHDSLSARPVLPEEENRFPVNRRIFLDGVNFEAVEPYEPELEIATAGAAAGPSGDDEAPAPVYMASNEPQRQNVVTSSGPPQQTRSNGSEVTASSAGSGMRGI